MYAPIPDLDGKSGEKRAIRGNNVDDALFCEDTLLNIFSIKNLPDAVIENLDSVFFVNSSNTLNWFLEIESNSKSLLPID
ncbi:hypothetical protein OA093_00605, partial [bacterium]|nr:hypothetical protein [bacterium]